MQFYKAMIRQRSNGMYFFKATEIDARYQATFKSKLTADMVKN